MYIMQKKIFYCVTYLAKHSQLIAYKCMNNK